jgi:Ca2+-binding RTX toxin-like protein
VKAVSSKSKRSANPLRAACSGVVVEEVEPRILLASLDQVPALHSLPSAHAKIYLDFNGYDAIPDWLGSNVPTTPAFDLDGKNDSFTGGELAAINEIWSRVSEKYSPFNIDVTTVDPGNLNDKETTHVVIGGDGAWLGAPAGGVAGINGFYDPNIPNVCFVFSDGFGNAFQGIAEAAAHEAGHTFGLQHHSTFDSSGQKTQEYDPGTPAKAPIMGVSYYSARGLWWLGPNSLGVDVIQDDVKVLSDMTTNGFGYRADDYGNNFLGATNITPTTGAAVDISGVIEQTTDVDAFRIDVNNGFLNIRVDGAPNGPMLDATLKVLDAFGNVVAQSASTSLSETLSTSLTAGSYVIQVSSAGNYGDIGQYTLTGTLPGGGLPPVSGHYLVEGTNGDDNINITLQDNAYHVVVNGEDTVLDATTITQFDVLAGDGNDVVTLGPGVCKMYCLGGSGNDTINGGDFDDTITGSAGNDLIFGFGGNDRLAGGSGSDILVGGNGRDRLYGDDGNDVLKGGSSVDRLYGGEGADVLSGESGDDKEDGQNGNDTIYGGEGADILTGGEGFDYLYGNDGNDTLNSRDSVFDYVNGGAGSDKAQVDPATIDSQDSLEELLP